MDVHARLTRRLSHIHADVVSVWLKLLLHPQLRPAKKIKHGALLLDRHSEEIGDVTPGNDQ